MQLPEPCIHSGLMSPIGRHIPDIERGIGRPLRCSIFVIVFIHFDRLTVFDAWNNVSVGSVKVE